MKQLIILLCVGILNASPVLSCKFEPHTTDLRVAPTYCKAFSYKTTKKEVQIKTTCQELTFGRKQTLKNYFLVDGDLKEKLIMFLKSKRTLKINGVVYNGNLSIKYEQGDPATEHFKLKVYSFTFKNGLLETVNLSTN